VKWLEGSWRIRYRLGVYLVKERKERWQLEKYRDFYRRKVIERK
jgi:hypothetical protein